MVNTIIEYHEEHESYRCGYCRKPDTNFSHGMWAHMMSVSDYQQLIKRGWRRSGKHCYKPTMDVLCCPMYTIRCRALEFKVSRSQKKIIKKVNKYLSKSSNEAELSNSELHRSKNCKEGDEMCEGGGDQFVEAKKKCSDVVMSSILSTDSGVNTNQGQVEESNLSTDPSTEFNKTVERKIKPGVGLDFSKGPCKKAKQIRLERKIEKLRQKGINVETVQRINKNVEKQLEDFLQEIPDDVRNELEVRLVRTCPPSEDWLSSAKEAHRVYSLYQMAVHGDTPRKCSESQFHDFLVCSPLQEEYREDGPACGYGSFHQQYWLGSRLVACGVIDILPECVSSVYFFYDPNFRFLTFGTYGALREIAFVRQLQKSSPKLKYYYMGFYIHSCLKMRYKGNFQPSELLCPETYKWFPIVDCIPKLDMSPYSRLHPDIDIIDEDACTERHLDGIPLLVNSSVIKFGTYKRLKPLNSNKKFAEILLQYGQLVGATCASRMIMYKD